MAAQVVRILDEPSFRRQLIEKGKQRARLYTWENTARRMLEFYRRVLSLRRGRLMGLGIRTWLFYERGLGKNIPSVDLAQIFPTEIFKLDLQVSFGALGGVMPTESVFLASLACFLKAKNVFEFGTCTGMTTYNLASHVSGRVYTLDLPKENAAPWLRTEHAEQAFMKVKNEDLFWRGKPGSEKIVQLLGDSARFDFSPYHGKMDLVFVDASHSVEYVRNDSEKALQLLAPGGAIVWHDYMPAWPGVVRALNELSGRVPLRHVRGTAMVFYKK